MDRLDKGREREFNLDMAEGGVSPDIKIAQATTGEKMHPESARWEAKQLRQQLESVVLNKGLIRREDKVDILRDGRKLTREGYVVPEAVSNAFKTNPVYKEFHGGVTNIQVLSDNRGHPVTEVRFWDDQVKQEKAIHFSVGKGALGGGDRTLAFFPAHRGIASELHFYYQDDENRPADYSNTRPETFQKMKPELEDALTRLKRFPDTFRPSRGQRIMGAIRSAVSPKR